MLKHIFSQTRQYFGYLLVCFLIYLITDIKCSNECEDSKTDNIRLCQTGADCFPLPHSYSCLWIVKGKRKSAYIPLLVSDVPAGRRWNLHNIMPPPVNECDESAKNNLTLCHVGSTCHDQRIGYQCVDNKVDKRCSYSYVRDVCEQQDVDWTCPDYETLPACEDDSIAMNNYLDIAIEQEDEMKENINSTKLETLENRLNETLHMKNSIFQIPVNNSQEAATLFSKSTILVDKMLENLAQKMQSMEKPPSNISITVAHISVAMTVVQVNVTRTVHVFEDSKEENVIIQVDQTQSRTKDIVVAIKKVQQNGTLFEALKNNSNNQRIISSLIGVNVYGNGSERATATIQIKHSINVTKNEQHRLRCASWDANRHKAWNYDICTKLPSVRNDRTVCQCKKPPPTLALLFDLGNADYDPHSHFALHVLTYISCSLSILSLAPLLLLRVLIRVGKMNFIYIILSLGLLLGNLFFLIGTFLVEQPAICPIVAVLTQFSFLLAFTWKLILGCNVLFSLGFPLRDRPAIISKPCYIIPIGFILPGLLVGIAAAVSYGSYGQDNESCWISKDSPGTFLTFIIPVCLVLLVNMVILVYVGRKLSIHTQTVKKFRESANGINEWLVLFKISLCMGLMWISGPFINAPKIGIGFAFVFALANGLQGVLLLLNFAVFSKESKAKVSQFFTRSTTSSTMPRTSSNRDGIRTGTTQRSTSSSHAPYSTSTQNNTTDDYEIMPFINRPVNSDSAHASTSKSADEYETVTFINRPVNSDADPNVYDELTTVVYNPHCGTVSFQTPVDENIYEAPD